MGNDNQDYFKRAGRSIGPAGSPANFRSTVGQERAVLRREVEHRIPGEHLPRARRVIPRAPEASEPEGARPRGDRAKGNGHASAADGHDRERDAAARASDSGNGHDRAFDAAATAPESGDGHDRDPEVAAAGDAHMTREIETFWHEMDPREEEAPYGFGIPASEEAAIGHETRFYERETRAHQAQAHEEMGLRRAPFGERMARSFPRPFRLLGRTAHALDRPIRRTLDRLQSLGEIARHS